MNKILNKVLNKKVFTFLILFTILFASIANVNAAININTNTNTNINTNTVNKPTNNTSIPNPKNSVGTTTMEIVDEKICKMNLQDMGNFTKKLSKYDLDKKEVELTLNIQNTMNKEETKLPIEVFLVLDNSSSMTQNYKNINKKSYVTNTAEKFVDNLFNSNPNAKIGLVTFSSLDLLLEENKNKQVGTMDDSKLLLELSNSKEIIKSKINEYSAIKVGAWTNIEAGLERAKNNFSSDTTSKKYIILLSDLVPNLSLDTTPENQKSGEVTATNTKNKLIELSQEGIEIFTILASLDDAPITCPTSPIIADGSRHMTYGEYSETIFGNESNPTVGNLYHINYDLLEQTINDKILKEIISIKENSLKNIVIKDYFPKEIIENFNFEYIKTPNVGNVLTEIDKKDNSITWNIETLKEQEIASLTYKLTLKENYNKEIVNKIIPTNTKVNITFDTSNNEHGEIFNEDSPSIRIKYSEPIVKKDDTIANKPIPQTGTFSNFSIIILISLLSIFAITKFIKFKNK